MEFITYNTSFNVKSDRGRQCSPCNYHCLNIVGICNLVHIQGTLTKNTRITNFIVLPFFFTYDVVTCWIGFTAIVDDACFCCARHRIQTIFQMVCSINARRKISVGSIDVVTCWVGFTAIVDDACFCEKERK